MWEAFMSETVGEKKIRLGEVANALGVPPKLIRNWTAAQEFDLFGSPDRPQNKWREYSYFDVAHLAIAAQMIRYGFSVAEAHDFAGATLARLFEPLLAMGSRFGKAPAGVIEAACQNKDLYLFKLSDGDVVAIMTPMDQLPRYPAALHIDLLACIGSAFLSLAEMGHDAHADSQPKEYTAEEADALRCRFQERTENGD
jgi:hypothetical protein